MRWTEEQYQEFKKKKKGLPVEPQSQRKSKYNNQKTMVDGIKFDSKKEAEYYCQLKLLKQVGEIKDFGLQQKFELQEGFEKNNQKYRPITYYADFVVDHLDGTTEVIDIKSSKYFNDKRDLLRGENMHIGIVSTHRKKELSEGKQLFK